METTAIVRATELAAALVMAAKITQELVEAARALELLGSLLVVAAAGCRKNLRMDHH